MDSSTRQINNIMLAAVPTANYQGTIQNLSPFEQQRDQMVDNLKSHYASVTNEMVQTKNETDTANLTKRYLKKAQEQHHSIESEIEHEKAQLDSLTKEMRKQLARQKVMIDLCWVLGATLLVYLLFSSFSFVHILAMIVLVGGIVYVVVYNAYRVHISSHSDSSKNGPVPPSFPVPSSWNPADWWKSLTAPSLDLSTTTNTDTSKWTSMIPEQSQISNVLPSQVTSETTS
jgi:hypothetical protein